MDFLIGTLIKSYKEKKVFDFVLLIIMLYVIVYKSLGMPKFLPINFHLQQIQSILHKWGYALMCLYFR